MVYIVVVLLLLLLLLLLLTAVELSLGGNTDKTSNIYTYINETIQKYSTKNIKHSQYVQVHILPKLTHITKPTHTHTHTLQNKLKQPQFKIYPNEIVTV
jgi:hypothetical protein